MVVHLLPLCFINRKAVINVFLNFQQLIKVVVTCPAIISKTFYLQHPASKSINDFTLTAASADDDTTQINSIDEGSGDDACILRLSDVSTPAAGSAFIS